MQIYSEVQHGICKVTDKELLTFAEYTLLYAVMEL